jgi:hypothetical protein
MLYNIFVQFGFSSYVTSDRVILNNFIKNFNFCGTLYFNSLVAKSLGDLYSDGSANFQSNDWQKSPVKYWFIESKAWLFIQRKMVLITNRRVQDEMVI